MDVNLCFPCGKCPEFCPVGCIEYMKEGTLPNRGLQPVQVRFEECIGCYICVEICALLTDYDAVRMYDTSMVEELLGVKVGDQKPAEYHPARRYPTLVALHDGRGARSALEWWGPEAARHGFIVVAPEYLSPGESPDYRYSADEHAAVLLSLYDARKRFSVDPDRVFGNAFLDRVLP